MTPVHAFVLWIKKKIDSSKPSMLHNLENLWPQLQKLSNVHSLTCLLPQFGFEDTMVDRFPYQDETTEKRNLLICTHLTILVAPLMAIVMEYAHEEVYDVSCVNRLHKFIVTFNDRFHTGIIQLWDVIDDIIMHGSMYSALLIRHFLNEYKLSGILYLVQRVQHLANRIECESSVPFIFMIGLCCLNLCPCETRSQNKPCICVVH